MLIVVVHENAIGSKVQCPQIVYRNLELFWVCLAVLTGFIRFKVDPKLQQTDQTRFDTLSGPITHSVL